MPGGNSAAADIKYQGDFTGAGGRKSKNQREIDQNTVTVVAVFF
nr:hypothetical protein [Paenibacillus macerans]